VIRANGWVQQGAASFLICVIGASAGCGAAGSAQESSTPDGPDGDGLTVSMPGVSAPAREERLADSTLARLVREIQPAVERSAGIAARAPLNVAATDEERLHAYLSQQITTQLSREEAASVTAAYARLGLVPDSLDLQALFLALLEEQVVGYYDPKTDTLFVHERVSVEELEPVLAHELVHALQDQHVALDEVLSGLAERNDASTAAQAAIEGHATFAMMEWTFARMTGSAADLTQLPDLGASFENLDLTQLGDFGPVEILANAPTVVREGLLFPYIGGLVFLQRLWKQLPTRTLPFGAEMPESTEQVLHVDRWLAGDRPTTVEFVELADGWDVVYAKDLGELETRIFLAEHLEVPLWAERAAAGWDGDAYRLLRRGDAEALVWVSVWDTAADADEFAEAATEAYARFYAGEDRVPDIARATLDGRAVVRILDTPVDVTLPAAAAAFELRGGEDIGRQLP